MTWRGAMDNVRAVPLPVWLIGGAALVWWWWPKADPFDKRGPLDKLTDTIYPPSDCAKAMNSGDMAGAAWSCRPATFAAWLANGRQKGCSVLEDGKISCKAPTKPAAPTEGGGGGFGGRGGTRNMVKGSSMAKKKQSMAGAVVARLKEPSTWAGFAVLAGMLGNTWAPDNIGIIVQAGTAVAGLVAVALPEGEN